MKKIILSSALVLAFVVYALQQRTNPVANNINPALPVNNGNKNSSNPNTLTAMAYKDGEYTGASEDAYYGNVQIKAIIKNGKIADIQILDFPQDRNTSITINSEVLPQLKAEAIKAQSAKIDVISGATDTSQAFMQSLSSALKQAA